MTLHCAGRGCSKDPPAELHSEVSSALTDGGQLLHAGTAGRRQWGSTAQPCCLWTQLQQSVSFQDMWHFWLLQSIKWWKGKLSGATPSLKCFTAASAMLDLWMMSISRGAVFCVHAIKEKTSQLLFAAAHLWLSHYTILCLSTMCWCWCTKKCTPGHKCPTAERRMEPRMEQYHGTNCEGSSSRAEQSQGIKKVDFNIMNSFLISLLLMTITFALIKCFELILYKVNLIKMFLNPHNYFYLPVNFRPLQEMRP